MEDVELKQALRRFRRVLKPLVETNTKMTIAGLSILCCLPAKGSYQIAKELGLDERGVQATIYRFAKFGWVNVTRGANHHQTSVTLTETGKGLFAHLLPKPQDLTA
ncbi:MarR family winged helix-turn-helix transcriptional regulator [Verrucomicrobium spinosum]|uniref:MarR family winged helix-turn-helix transcriptional regulator n=1 Tax=Verrucomicrobium spinosum TaxID=2736 RepID=UPI00017455A4|nr:MarR family winged helix-turn-helix transcriptional regulator [Verrucomicrobium spinosum]